VRRSELDDERASAELAAAECAMPSARARESRDLDVQNDEECDVYRPGVRFATYDSTGARARFPTRFDAFAGDEPRALTLEVERARGLRAYDRRKRRMKVRAMVSSHAKGEKEENETKGRTKAYASAELVALRDDDAPRDSVHATRRSWERQRMQTAVSKKASPCPVFRTKFEFYASRALETDAIRLRAHGKRGGAKGDVELGVVDIPLSRVLATSDDDYDDRPFWVALDHRERVKEDLGVVKFHAYFDHETKGKLRVVVASARGVKAADANGLSDPYVKVTLRRGKNGVLQDSDRAWYGEKMVDERRTKVIPKTLNPEWNEEFEFIRVDRSSDAMVTFELYDRDVLSEDDILGQFAFAVKDLKAARAGDAQAAAREAPWRAPTNKLTPLGSLNVVAYFEDDLREHVFAKVSSARNICAANEFGVTNAFIVATCGTEFFQTAPVPGTLNPRWDQTMRFQVTEPPPTALALKEGRKLTSGQKIQFALYHRAEDDRALFIGHAYLPLHRLQTASEGGNKHSHWLPLVERNLEENLGEVRIRVFFSSNAAAPRPPVPVTAEGESVDKEAQNKVISYDATKARIIRERKEYAAAAALRVAANKIALHAALADSIASKLRAFSWPEELVPSYAKAYAACANAPELLPPPPTGCKLPQDVIRMFEAAALSRVEKPIKATEHRRKKRVEKKR